MKPDDRRPSIRRYWAGYDWRDGSSTTTTKELSGPARTIIQGVRARWAWRYSGNRSNIYPNFTGPEVPRNLKFSRHTHQNWDKLPPVSQKHRVYPNACPRPHRPQNPQPAAIRQPHDHAG